MRFDIETCLAKKKDFVRAYFMIASNVLKSKFEKLIVRYFRSFIFSSEISYELGINQEEVQKEFNYLHEFAGMLGKLSVRDNRFALMILLCRDKISAHPIFKLGASILLEDENLLEVFWSFVFKAGAKSLNKLSTDARDDYKRILIIDLNEINS